MQAFALNALIAIVAICCGALGFAAGRLLGKGRQAAAAESARRSEAVLASALESGLAAMKAQQQAMRARADASERLNTEIVQSLSAGLLVVDAAGRVEILNPAAQRILGLAPLDQPTAYTELLAHDQPLATLIEQCRAARAPVARETIALPRDPRPLQLGVTVSPLQIAGTGGQPQGVICLFSDLTAIVEMEDQLRLKDALARLGELTAGLAHEFRNGLATIHGYARLFDVTAMPPAYRPYVEEIRRETDQLGRVVTNFLAFARPEQLSRTLVSLEGLVRQVRDELLPELPPGTTVDVEGRFAVIAGDDALLTHVFDNLLRNAAQACAAAGTPPRLVVRGTVDADSCRVDVDDNGPGIPAAERERIFRPFVTTRHAGTGLGLAIVQKIVLAHDGRVTAGASPSGGARLSLVFPLPAQAAHALAG